MANVLVVGANRGIGYYLVERLLELENKLVNIIRPFLALRICGRTDFVNLNAPK